MDSGLECRMELVGEFAIRLSADLRCNNLRLIDDGMFGEVEPEDEFSAIKKYKYKYTILNDKFILLKSSAL